jgi:serine/threonine-protein kinase
MNRSGDEAGKVVPLTALRRIPSARPAAREERYVPGQLIQSKYRLESILGQGGMGEVWLARNVTLDVDVAIKLIHADVASPIASQRLLVEARSAARLEHPSIVRVFDFGETERGDPFIVMEVVRGESLGELLGRKGRLAAPFAVQLLLPIVDALSVAHGRGIIHRDVKPDNIILMTGDNGTLKPKLVDFGVAKDAPRGSDPPLAVRERRAARPLTQAGTVVGSPEYMSPEQALASGAVDSRSDIWGLSIVLYEAMCGARPFEGADFAKLALAINVAAPLPTTERGAGDLGLWHILERGLRKDPGERWTSMRAMGCALAAWLQGHGVRTDVTGAALEAHWLSDAAPAAPVAPSPGAGVTPRPHLWWLVVVAALSLAVVASLAAWLVTRSTQTSASEPAPLPSPTSERQPTTGQPAEAPSTLAEPPTSEAVAPRAAPPSDEGATEKNSSPPAPTVKHRSHGSKREQAAPDDPGF